MSNLGISVPENIDDPEELRSFLFDLINRLNTQITNHNLFSPVSIMPDNAQAGRVYYFSAAISGTDVTSSGMWYYNGTNWRKMEVVDFALEASLGNITGYDTENKHGESDNADNGAVVDLWDGSSVAAAAPTKVWVPPTAARIHNLASTAAADAIAGTGAQKVQVWGLPSWTASEVTEVIDMNGVANVATSNSYVIIHRMEVIQSGTGGLAAGEITATAVTDATVTASIQAGYNRTKMLIYGIPSNKKLRMTNVGLDFLPGGGGGAVNVGAEMLVMIDPANNVANNTMWSKYDDFVVSDTDKSTRKPYYVPKKIDGPAIVKLQALADAGANHKVSGFWNAYLVDN